MPPKRGATKSKAAVAGDGPSPPKVTKREGRNRKEAAEVASTIEEPTTESSKQSKTKKKTATETVKEVRPTRGAKKQPSINKEETTEEDSPSRFAREKSVKRDLKPKNGVEKEELVTEKPKKGAKKAAVGAQVKEERPKRGVKNMDKEVPKEQEQLDEEIAPKKTARGKTTKEKTKKTVAKKEVVKGVKATNGNAREPGAKLLNKSATKWDTINFSCEKKNARGEEFNLKITSWNIAGARAWLNKGGLDIFKYDSPDIMCLQEFKCSEDKLPEALKTVEGYKGFRVASEQEGYAGVAVYSKILPIEVYYGINDEDFDNEGRCITLEYEKFYLVNVYVPNAGRGLKTLDKRMDWNDVFKKYIKSLDDKKPVILCGDMNVAHEEIDLANPKQNAKNAGFTPQEREGLTAFLKDGYVDTFRELYPDTKGAYTFWSFMGNSRSRNVGWRLDYFIVSNKISQNVCDCVMRNEVFGSDHCPISLFINI